MKVPYPSRRPLRIAQAALPVLALLCVVASRVALLQPAEQVRIVNTGQKNPASRGAEVWVFDVDKLLEEAVVETNFRRSGSSWISTAPGQFLVLKGSPEMVTLLHHDWSGVVRIESGRHSWDVDLFSQERVLAAVPVQQRFPVVLSTWLPIALLAMLLLISLGDMRRAAEALRVRLVRRGGLGTLRPIRQTRHFLEDRRISGLLLTVLVVSVAYFGTVLAGGERPVSFAMIGHPYPLLRTASLERAVQDLASDQLDLVILAGDLVKGPDYERDYRYVRNLFRHERLLAVPGNHDVDSGSWNQGEARDRLARRFEREFGPLHGFRTLGECLFIHLNTCSTVYPEPYGLDDEELAFLRETLEDHSGYRHKFVVMHHMLWRFSDSSDNPRFKDSGWREKVVPLLKEHGVSHVLAGDSPGPLHQEIDGIHYLAVGFPVTGAGTESSYLKVDVRGSAVTFDWVFLPPEDLPPLPVYDVRIRPGRMKSFRSIRRDERVKVDFRCGEFESKGKIRLRGDTAANWAFRKKSYLLSLDQPYRGRTRLKLFIPADRRYQVEDLNAYRASKLGLLAPRVELVRLRVNGVDYGVYQDIEDLDKVFLETKSTTGDCNLYTCIDFHGDIAFNGGWNPIFENVNFWEKKTRDAQRPAEWSDLALLLDVINGRETSIPIDRVLDLDNFYAWRIHSLLAGSGHQSLIANMRFYFDPTRGRLFLVPWDVGLDASVRFLHGRSGRQFWAPRLVSKTDFEGPVNIPLESNNNPLVAAVLADPARQLELNRRLWRYVSDPENRRDDIAFWEKLHAKYRRYHLLDDRKAASNVQVLNELAFERFILRQNMELLEQMLADNTHTLELEAREGEFMVRVTVGNVSGLRLESDDPSVRFDVADLVPDYDRSRPFGSRRLVGILPRQYEVRIRSDESRDRVVERLRAGELFRMSNLVTGAPVDLGGVQ